MLIAAYPLLAGLLAARAPASTGPALSSTPSGLLLACSIELLLFGAVFGLAWISSRASIDDLLLRARAGLVELLALGVGYSIALRLALVVGATLIMGLVALAGLMSPDDFRRLLLENRPQVETLVDVASLRHDPVYLGLTLTLVSFVVAGLREELWRAAFLCGAGGLWPERFGSQAGQMAAVCVAAVVFGIGHLSQGSVGVIATGLLGFGLGAIMVVHRSIWPAVLAHGVFNATSFAMLPFMGRTLEPLALAVAR